MALSQSAQTAILTKIRSARNVVILSGAGLSAESGIPTFRDASNSLWANVDPMAVASLDGFERDPEQVWAWHEAMRQHFAAAAPNAAHEAIARLEALLQPATVQVITQNIDGFHQLAGSSRVLELHGSARTVRCHRRCGYLAPWDDVALRDCPICGSPVRPDVVWFGESLDPTLFEFAQTAAETADVFLTVGTSGVVQPAASLAVRAKNHGALWIEVNPGETPQRTLADYAIQASATEFFTSLCQAIRAMKLRQIR
jgi:NAD-dependent deacetylase